MMHETGIPPEVPKVLRPLIANGTTGAYRELFVWLFRVSVIAGFFYIKANYLGIEKYEREREVNLNQWIELGKTLTRIEGKVEDLPRVEADYENRLRKLEAQRNARP